jgi:hypothetical protein
MDALSRLEEIGFTRVGRWVLDSGRPAARLETGGSQADVLYAFVSGRSVLYVGKTRMTLAKRLYGYQNPGPSQRTNRVCNKHICELLGTQRSLEVFVRCEDGVRQIGSFAVSQAAALEDAIIRELKPAWNKMGKPGELVSTSGGDAAEP